MNIPKLVFKPGYLSLTLSIVVVSSLRMIAQESQPAAPNAPGESLLDQGYLDRDAPDFTLKLVKSSQTAATLQPKGAGAAEGCDFTPSDWLKKRAANGYRHLGDLILRVRKGKADTERIDRL
jgi:Family of unknown function (DUF5695)